MSASPAQKPAPLRGIYEREPDSGVWWIRYADSTGKIRREKAGTRAAAKQLYSIRKTDSWTGKKLPHTIKGKKLTFADLTKDCLVYSQANKKSYQDDVERMKPLVELFGSTPADTLTGDDIEAKLGKLATEREWSKATMNRYLALLSLTYRLAIEKSTKNKNKNVTINPAHDVKRRSEKDNEIERFLTPEEEIRLRAVIQPEHAERWAVVQLAIHTGCRIGELYALRWTEVNLNQSLVTFLRTKNGEKRHVPLNTTALTALDTLAKFQGTDGHVIPQKPYRFWFEKAVKTAKVENFTEHCLRHTAASRLVMSGVSLTAVAKILGHQNVRTTERYTHLAPEHLAEAVSKLDGFGTGSKTGTVSAVGA